MNRDRTLKSRGHETLAFWEKVEEGRSENRKMVMRKTI